MLMDDESIGVNMDSGLCDQISNDILEMMVRSCPFKNAAVGCCWFAEMCYEMTRGSVAGKPEALHDLKSRR